MERHRRRVPASFTMVAAVCGCLAWMGFDVHALEGGAASPGARIMDAFARVSPRPSVAYTAHRRLTGELLDNGERGWVEVLTQFDPRSGMRYLVVSEGGSERIRRRALHTVLQKEVDASRRSDPSQSAFSLTNYQFGITQTASEVVRIALTPLRRDARLISGVATVHPRSATLVQVDGELAKDPSFWVKDVRVALRYASIANATLPVQLFTWARVRMFGPARLQIDVRYLTVDGRSVGVGPGRPTPASARFGPSGAFRAPARPD